MSLGPEIVQCWSLLNQNGLRLLGGVFVLFLLDDCSELLCLFLEPFPLSQNRATQTPIV